MSLLPTTVPIETDDERIGRLEREIAAAWRNHALLRRSADQVARNNVRLRTGIRELVEALPQDPDLGPVVEKLEDALTIPFAYRRPSPQDPRPDDRARPERPDELTSFLTGSLNEIGRACYLLQEASTPIAWNSETIRDVLRELVEEMAPDDECDEGDPATADSTLIGSIVDGIATVMKAGADPKI